MKHRFSSALIAALGLFCFVPMLSPRAVAQRAITIEDYFQIREVKDPQLSPDGQWIAYTVKTPLLDRPAHQPRDVG